MLNNPLLPTAYLAPIEYYAILLKYQNCSIEYYENFIKQSIRNRCNIYTANGKLTLTIPKLRKSRSKILIKDIEICYKENWQKTHWQSIESAYNSSPFFEFYKEEIKPLFIEKEKYLIEFNSKLHNVVLKFLYQELVIKKTNNYQKKSSLDLRNYNWNKRECQPYNQVFEEKHGFIPNLSILDLLCNLGPQSTQYLESITI